MGECNEETFAIKWHQLTTCLTYLNQLVNVLRGDGLVSEILLADGVSALRRLVPVGYVQIIGDDTREVGLQFGQQLGVHLKTCAVKVWVNNN